VPKCSRRMAIAVAVAWCGAVVCNDRVLAQNWPTRPVTLVVPFVAGSGSDLLARIFTPRLGEILGQQVIIENVGGAGGMTGASRVARAVPDGYQLVLGGVDTFAQNQSLYKKPLYNSATDFAPVAPIVEQPLVLIARKDLPAGNLQEFIAYAKANATTMQYGSAGAGSASHLACALLASAIGANITHVPYRGGAPAMQDLVAGRIDFQCPLPATAIPQIENRAVKAVTTLSKNRSPVLPNLASAQEQGLDGFEAIFWNAIFLPKNTPAEIVKKLNSALVAMMDTPATQERLKENGAIVVAPDRRSPAYLQKFIETETAKWAATIKASGILID
jgi:tripartite-type tricarboxylate transporter receptor subunit TctC